MDEGRKQDHLCPGDKPVCDLCDTKIDHELSKCLACNVYMCRICTTAHQRVSATKQHNIVARIERISSKSQNVSQMCKTHEDEEIAFYCYTCNDFICSECILGNHKGHNGVKFNDFANQKRREINEKLNQAREAQKSEITKLTKQIEEKEKENDENDKDTENQIQDRKTQIIAEVDKIINCLKDEKTKIHKQNKDKLEAVKAQVTQGSPEFNKLCAEYDNFLRTGSDMEVVMFETEMYQKLESVPSVDADIDIQINRSHVVSGKADDKPVVSLSAYVQSNSSEQREPAASQPNLRGTSYSTQNVQVMSTFCTIAEKVYSICPLSDDTAIIQYCNSYNNDRNVVVCVAGQIKKIWMFDFPASEIIMTSHGDIIATDNNKPSLHKLTKGGVKTQTISTSPLQCTGICEARDGKLLVCFLDKLSYVVDNSSRRLVSRLTMGGTTVKSYEHHNGSRLFTWPQGVSENINEDICVVDKTSKTSGRLVVIDKTGKLKSTYEGQKLPQPFLPFYVKCDKSGHVIVNDFYNTKVHMLDMDGRFIRYIADENILKNYPLSLEFDKNGVLWVGCYNGNVYKLKY